MGEEKLKGGRMSRGFFSFIKGRKRLWLLVGGLCLGVALLILGAVGSGEEDVETVETVNARVEELAAYEARVEKELETLCEAVSGVGDCEVMVTFERGYTVKYTEDGDKNPVSVGSGSSEEALFESLLPPAVAGVGIVCRGGKDPTVQQVLTELVSTTLGIPANRVLITGK